MLSRRDACRNLLFVTMVTFSLSACKSRSFSNEEQNVADTMAVANFDYCEKDSVEDSKYWDYTMRHPAEAFEGKYWDRRPHAQTLQGSGLLKKGDENLCSNAQIVHKCFSNAIKRYASKFPDLVSWSAKNKIDLKRFLMALSARETNLGAITDKMKSLTDFNGVGMMQVISTGIPPDDKAKWQLIQANTLTQIYWGMRIAEQKVRRSLSGDYPSPQAGPIYDVAWMYNGNPRWQKEYATNVHYYYKTLLPKCNLTETEALVSTPGAIGDNGANVATPNAPKGDTYKVCNTTDASIPIWLWSKSATAWQKVLRAYPDDLVVSTNLTVLLPNNKKCETMVEDQCLQQVFFLTRGREGYGWVQNKLLCKATPADLAPQPAAAAAAVPKPAVAAPATSAPTTKGIVTGKTYHICNTGGTPVNVRDGQLGFIGSAYEGETVVIQSERAKGAENDFARVLFTETNEYGYVAYAFLCAK